jgi:hypothetical protein
VQVTHLWTLNNESAQPFVPHSSRRRPQHVTLKCPSRPVLREPAGPPDASAAAEIKVGVGV